MKKLIRVGVLMLLMASMLQINVFAHGGNGGGKNKLKLETTIPENKGKIGVSDSIKLKFSNNVVNMKVAENNKACFKLIDSDGNNIDIKVVMGDDQVKKDIKNDIEIVPVKHLEEGQTYKLIIDGRLMAKNGMELKNEEILTFNTEGSSGFSLDGRGVMVLLPIGMIFFVIFKNKKS